MPVSFYLQLTKISFCKRSCAKNLHSKILGKFLPDVHNIQCGDAVRVFLENHDIVVVSDQFKGSYFMCVDLPCSFVADTLTLPLTFLIAVGEEEDSLQMGSDRKQSQGGGPGF